MALDATVGGASANSYCTELECEQYHEAHVSGAVWTSPSDSDLLEPALLQAARLLDAEFAWAGTIASESQAMGWPRIGAYDQQGRLIGSSLIPQAIKHAQSELARQLLAGDRAADSDLEAQGVTGITVGAIELEFAPGQAKTRPIPDAVRALIGVLGQMRTRGFSAVTLERA